MPGAPPWGDRADARTLRVFLDPNQYYLDNQRHLNENAEDVYTSFNLIVRRKSKENNFKAVSCVWPTRAREVAVTLSAFWLRASVGGRTVQVLETIRDLMQSNAVVPEWLHDVFLGYGDPGTRASCVAPTGGIGRGGVLTCRSWWARRRPHPAEARFLVSPRATLALVDENLVQDRRTTVACRTRSPPSTFWTRSCPRSTCWRRSRRTTSSFWVPRARGTRRSRYAVAHGSALVAWAVS